jgi:hypothetical protein
MRVIPDRAWPLHAARGRDHRAEEGFFIAMMA